MRWSPMPNDQWAPRTVVKVSFERDPDTGEIDHLAPFRVTDRGGRHAGVYEDEPQVVVEMEPETSVAYFEAQWIAGRWVFSHRVPDESW